MKKYVLLILIAATALRLLFLDKIPPGLTNDEMNIAINAQSLLTTGENIPGVVTGIIGKTSGDLSMGIHSELGSYLIAPFIKLFSFNLISIKIPFVLASIGIVISGYFITKRLINQRAGVLALAVLAINPWLIFFGRSAYESILSCFFYMLSILLIINLSGWKKLFALVFLFAGFLSYFSAKTLVIPISLIASGASIFLNKKRDLLELTTLNLVVIAFVVGYAFILPKTPAGARIKELNSTNITQSVISGRTAALSSPLTPIFENKITEELTIRLSAGLGEFNPGYIFLNGLPEQTPALSIPNHGFMYLADIVFILMGIFFMARKYPKQLVFLVALIIITAIPNFLDLQGTTYSIRTVMLFPVLAIISAIGIYSIKNRYIKIAVVLIYTVSFLNFFFIYFSRSPIKRSEGWFFSQRVVSRYIQATVNKYPDKKIVLITKEPKLIFYKYLFYSGSYVNPKDINSLNKKMANMNYETGNLLITDTCTTKTADIIIQSASSDCPKTKSSASIKSISDTGDVYLIVNDLLCSNYPKNKYPLIKNFKDLGVEDLSVANFCKDYLSTSL